MFVRTDLSIPQRAVQVAHACMEAAKNFHWEIHPHLVVLAVNNESELLDRIEYLKANKVDFCLFREEDIEFQATALATQPVYNEQRKLFRNFKLLKGE